jgi:hypothetical protein
MVLLVAEVPMTATATMAAVLATAEKALAANLMAMGAQHPVNHVGAGFVVCWYSGGKNAANARLKRPPTVGT